jgi:glucose/arabinose dehydrogenase
MKAPLALLIALLCVLSLSACAPGDDPATRQAESTPITSETPEGDDPPLMLAPVTLEVAPEMATGNFSVTRQVNLPQGFGIKVFAVDLDHVRQMAISPDGVLYATARGANKVVRLPDENGDGVADRVEVVAENVQGVHGIEFDKDGVLHVATEIQVIKLEDEDGDGKTEKRTVIVDGLPTGGVGRAGENHSTRTIRFGSDGKLYVSIGSSCNFCVEEDERRAAINRYSADGKFEKVYAQGIRNAVGVQFHPETGEMWAVNNGRDGLGEDSPPEGVLNIKEGQDYGWPYCYGTRLADPELSPEPGYCEKVDLPAFFLPAHYAPLGLTFYYGGSFPDRFKGDMFAASHGSWDRKVRHGYKVVRVRFKDNQPDTTAPEMMVEDFATGWLLDPATGAHWGRPVDVIAAPDGSLFLTDDASMAIYKIYFRESTSSPIIPGMPRVGHETAGTP